MYVCVRYMYVIYLFCFVSFEKIHNRNRKRGKIKSMAHTDLPYERMRNNDGSMMHGSWLECDGGETVNIESKSNTF